MDRHKLLNAAEFIEKNLLEPIQLADIAAAALLSERSLQRHFSAMVGESLASFVRGRRLTRAAERLLAGEPDLLGLALDCQFGSHEAFTRAFQRQYFMAPSRFRQHGQPAHSYGRPVLDDPALTELQQQWQQPPFILNQPAQSLWCWRLPPGEQAGAQLPQRIQPWIRHFQECYRPAKIRVLMCKAPGEMQPSLVLACPAKVTPRPPTLQLIRLPASATATFTLYGGATQLAVFLYHCYAQWLFFQGWHHADAPIELHFPSDSNRSFRLSLPISPTPIARYQLW